MAQNRPSVVAYQRSNSGLLADSIWFLVHTIAAVAVLMIIVAAITFVRPGVGSRGLKQIATALALLGPMLVAFVIAKVCARERCRPARFTWVSGLLVLAAAAVWVYGLPTGPGMCEGCGAAEKLWRTFFVLERGSGLMNGDGLLVGCWIPLATGAYAFGAALGLRL